MPPMADDMTDDDIEDLPAAQGDDEDDEIALINKFMDEFEAAAPAPGILEPMEEDGESHMLSEEEGRAQVEKARLERDAAGRFKAKDAEPETTAEEAASVEEVSPEPAKAEPQALTGLDALLDGLDDTRKTALRERITAADDMAGAIAPYADALKDYGETPKAQMARLAQITAYAKSNPTEYLAWAADIVAPGKAAETLGAVAERLGMKLVPVEDAADDPFEDDSIKALRAENRQLKAAAMNRQPIGPDGPAWQAQAQERQAVDDLTRWKDEKGADGKLLRPLFDLLGPQIAERMQALSKSNSRPATMQDLQAVYAQLHEQVTAAGGFAAQPTQTVPQPAKAAPQASANLERAKAASKSIGGTGQGAAFRPATTEDADVSSIVNKWFDEQGLK